MDELQLERARNREDIIKHAKVASRDGEEARRQVVRAEGQVAEEKT
jgi:hypothetical protein